MIQKLTIFFFPKKTKTDKNGKCPIYVRLTVDGKRAEFSTGIKILPELWNSQKQRLDGKKTTVKESNDRLTTLEAKINRQFNIMESQDLVISASELANEITQKNVKKHNLLEVYRIHNEEAKQRIDIDITYRTFQRYQSTYNKLKSFIQYEYHKADFPLESINHRFITSFDLFLKTHEKNQHNTTMKHITLLKKIIHMAKANEWISHDPFRDYKLTFKETKRDILTMEEIKAIAEKKFEIERLEKVKNIFLFAIFTGLSYAELKRLNKSHIQKDSDGKKWIVIYRQKTKTRSPIPLLDPALEILEKYKNNDECEIMETLLPVSSNQRLNSYLREIADVCGIQKKMTMHVARHTFATTITLSNGVPFETVGKMLGHNSIKTTKIYAKINDNKIAKDMSGINEKLSEQMQSVLACHLN